MVCFPGGSKLSLSTLLLAPSEFEMAGGGGGGDTLHHALPASEMKAWR